MAIRRRADPRTGETYEEGTLEYANLAIRDLDDLVGDLRAQVEALELRVGRLESDADE